MKKVLFIVIMFILSGCMKPIMINQYDEKAHETIMYGLNPQNDFFINTNINSDFILKWDNSTHGSFGNSSFISYDSLIIITDLGGRVTVFQLSDGKKVGELKYSGGIEQAAVLKKTYLIFIVNEKKEKNSFLVVYDIVNGKEVKSLPLSGKISNELILTNEFVYALSDFGVLYKISPWGSIEWKVELGVFTYSNPAADEEYYYLASVEGTVMKIDLKRGDLIAEYKISSGFESGISIDEENLYIGDNQGIFYGMNKSSGEIIWEYDTGYKIVQTPGNDNSSVFAANLNGDLYSFNKANGTLNWISRSNGLINASPLIFNNIILQTNLLKKVDIIDKSNGSVIKSLNFDSRCRTTPLYMHNTIIFGLDKGDVYCYSIE